MDRLTAMRVFAEVATSGSFSATADKLDMSRAMVTRYVAEMEQWLQARLLQRTTRSVTLTDAGELALRRCQQMLALTTDLEEETATTAEGELRGQLRLTCSVSFAYAQLGAAIADFLAQHPQLKIDLDASEGDGQGGGDEGGAEHGVFSKGRLNDERKFICVIRSNKPDNSRIFISSIEQISSLWTA